MACSSAGFGSARRRRDSHASPRGRDLPWGIAGTGGEERRGSRRPGASDLRILIVVSETPPIASGVARCSGKLISGLRAGGHDVDVISSLEIPRRALGEFRFSAFAAYWPRLARRLPSYDVVNVHGPAPTMSDAFLALAQTLAPIRRPPIVYTHHCSVDLAGWKAACRAYNRVHSSLALYADRIITTTESYRALMTMGPRPRVDVVPWGVDSERFTATRPAPRLPEQPLRVLFVGQMRPYKGIETLLKAVADEPRLELTLVGTGPLERHYRREAERLGARRARFLGFVSDDDLEHLYREHDAIALPSTTSAEAFGLVLLEGMAAGCVPIASDLPGVSDVARPTGVLVRPGDVEDLRGALLALQGDPERAWRLAAASQARARVMSWDSVVRSYEAIFRETLLEWRDQKAAGALPRAWIPPDRLLASVGQRFGASRTSLLLFDRPAGSALRSGWGAVRLEDLHGRTPRIARYVAETSRPLLLDPDVTAAPVRGWLARPEIASALSVPIRSSRGRLVLNLSIAAGEGRKYTETDLDSLVRFLSAHGLDGLARRRRSRS